MAIMIISGLTVKIDDDDLEKVSMHKWSMTGKIKHPYFKRTAHSWAKAEEAPDKDCGTYG